MRTQEIGTEVLILNLLGKKITEFLEPQFTHLLNGNELSLLVKKFL